MPLTAQRRMNLLMENDDHVQLTRLVGEVQELTASVRELIALTPSRSKSWLEPREFAALLGVSTRTIGIWRTNGVFRGESIRKQGKGYQFHGQRALVDAEKRHVIREAQL